MAQDAPDEEGPPPHQEARARRAVVESEYGAALLRLFADVDPWGLIAVGAPWDEYWPEVEDIMGRADAITADDVLDTFRRFATVTGLDGKLLDPQPVDGGPVASRADAQRLAHGIARLRQQ